MAANRTRLNTLTRTGKARADVTYEKRALTLTLHTCSDTSKSKVAKITGNVNRLSVREMHRLYLMSDIEQNSESLGPPNALTPAPEPIRLDVNECKEDEEAAAAGADYRDQGFSGDDEKKPSAAAVAARTQDLTGKEDFAEEFPVELPTGSSCLPPFSFSRDNEKKPSASAAAGVLARRQDLTDAKIRQNDFAEEFPVELPTGSKSLVPFASPAYASLPSADNRDYAPNDETKRLEHAPPGEVMRRPGQQTRTEVAVSLERPPVVLTTNHDVAPGAYRVPASYDSTRDFADEESKVEEEGVPSSAGADASAIAESGFHFVEAQRVPDGGETETTMIVEAQHVTMKWYQRPMYRWILAGSILFSFGLVGTVVGLVVRPPSGASNSSSAPTPAPTSLTPEQIACNFLFISNVTKCRSTVEFDSNKGGDKTNGFTIPSEIALLSRLTVLDFFSEELTGTIPTEMGLMPQLTFLAVNDNKLTGNIPSEIGELTQLTLLSFEGNNLTGNIPSEIGELTGITDLDFSINALTGSIPSEIGKLTQLQALSFHGNQLTGRIPSEIGELTQLEYLNFHNNDLSGTMPSSLCSLPSMEYGRSIYTIDCDDIACDYPCCQSFVGVPCVDSSFTMPIGWDNGTAPSVLQVPVQGQPVGN